MLNSFFLLDFQKLEREARICRKLQHPNIGKQLPIYFTLESVVRKIPGGMNVEQFFKRKHEFVWIDKKMGNIDYYLSSISYKSQFIRSSLYLLFFSVRLHDSIQEENFHYLVFDL